MQTSKKSHHSSTIFAVSIAALGGGELFLDGGTAEAAIVTGNFNKVNQASSFNISISGSFGNNGTSDASAYINGGSGSNFSWSYSSARLIAAGTTSSGSSANMLQLNAGSTVGAGLDFGDYAQLTNNFDGYIGFQFDVPGGVNYGWVRAVGNADGSVLSLTQYAYETDVNTAITIPGSAAIPEPNSLALLALGAAGLRRYRQQKTALAA